MRSTQCVERQTTVAWKWHAKGNCGWGEILLSTDGFIPAMQSNEIALKQRRRADRAQTLTRPARAQAARYKTAKFRGAASFAFAISSDARDTSEERNLLRKDETR